jgi:polysaccharide biosynthesis/export protein
MFKYLGMLAAVAMGVLLSGCSANMGPVIPYQPRSEPLAYEPSTRPTAASLLVIQKGDKIKVTVYGEDSLNGIYDVDPNGYVSLPLAGSVLAAGRSTSQLQKYITGKYRSEYLKDPKVSVEIAAYKPIYVMGEAASPGQQNYQSGMNLLNAIAAAGGLTYRASKSSVLIQHAGEDVWRETPMSASVRIMPGDIIRIPERYF